MLLGSPGILAILRPGQFEIAATIAKGYAQEYSIGATSRQQ
jgi:hypothetical protein